MSADVVARRMYSWRTFVWAGVVGSVLAWAWAWYAGRGAIAVMLLVAVASVVLAYRGTQGVRVAIVGLMVAGFVMFLASLYLFTQVLVAGAGGSLGAMDVITTSVFPMVAAIVLMLGATAGFRHARSA